MGVDKPADLGMARTVQTIVRVERQNPLAGGVVDGDVLRRGKIEPDPRPEGDRGARARAMSTVASVEPVSTTTISSATPATLSRQPGSRTSSFLTIKQTLSVGRATTQS
jgi:hypothetical protein